MPGPYRISGAVFPKNIPNGPVLSGSIEIDGVKHHISLWEKTSRNGTDFLQISEDKRPEKPAGGGGGNFGDKFKRPAPAKPSPLYDPKKRDDSDPFGGDDIPFAPEFR